MHCKILSKGIGNPIVFLHGFLGSATDWEYVASHLQNRTCISYDLPGHGQTPWTDMEIEDLISNALPPQNVHLVGYSLGGRLAMRFAIKHPQRISSLTLLSTHTGLQTESERQARLQNDRVWAQKILTLPFNDFLNTWYDQPLFKSLKQKNQLMKDLINHRQKQKSKDLIKAMLTWSLGRQDCYKERLRKFSRPLTILYGEHDSKYTALFQDMPNAHSIRGAGHAIHIEAPKEIASFL